MTAQVEDTQIAARYAKALFELAEEQGDLDTILKDLLAISDVLKAVPDLKVFLVNPGIPRTEKKSFVKGQFEGKVSPMVDNLLKLMVENERFPLIPLVAHKYEERVNQHQNIGIAEVITATELDSKLETKLEKALKTLYGFSQVRLTPKVDPALLGGAIIKVQDKVIDGSFAGKLNELKKQVS